MRSRDKLAAQVVRQVSASAVGLRQGLLAYPSQLTERVFPHRLHERRVKQVAVAVLAPITTCQTNSSLQGDLTTLVMPGLSQLTAEEHELKKSGDIACSL